MTNNYSKHFFRNVLCCWANDISLMCRIQRTISTIVIVGIVYLIVLFPILWLFPLYVGVLLLFIDLFIESRTIETVKEEGDDIRSDIWQHRYKENKSLFMLNPYTNLSDEELEEAFKKLNGEEKDFEEMMKKCEVRKGFDRL